MSTVAMNIGTNVDEWVKADIIGKGYPKIKTQEARNCVQAYQRWRCEYQPRGLRVGETLYDDDSFYAGTPDIFMGDTVIDVKCAARVSTSYWMQVNMYNLLAKRHSIVAILQLNKDLAIYDFHERPASDLCVQSFLGLLTAYRLYKSEDKSVTDGEEDEDDSAIDSASGEKQEGQEVDEPKDTVPGTRGNW